MDQQTPMDHFYDADVDEFAAMQPWYFNLSRDIK
jgi:hypothetical protein